MKEKIIFIAAFTISTFLVNVNSYSQDKKYFVSALSGISLPVGNISYRYTPGYNFEVRAAKKTSDNIGFGIDVSYSILSLKDQYGVNSGGQNTLLSIKGIAVFKNFNSIQKVIPYATIAAGLNMQRNADIQTIWGNFNSSGFFSSFAIDIGGGVSFKASEDIDIDLESKLNSSFDDPVRIISVNFKAGVNYNF